MMGLREEREVRSHGWESNGPREPGEGRYRCWKALPFADTVTALIASPGSCAFQGHVAPLSLQAPYRLPPRCRGANYQLVGHYFKCGGGVH